MSVEIELLPQDRMVRIDGKSFRCECGCNVFRSPKDDDTLYVCNSCGARFRGEKATKGGA